MALISLMILKGRGGGKGVSDRFLFHLGEAASAYAEVNSAFAESLREAILTHVTDPEDLALLPEFLPPRRSRH